jgi:transcriptional regulator with XRE-family HTH domain
MLMDSNDVVLALCELVDAEGSQQAFADSIGVSQSHLSDVMRGRREPGAKILRAMGLRRISRYEAAP